MMQALRDWLGHQGLSDGNAAILAGVAMVVGVVLLALVANFVAQRIILATLHRIAQRTRTDWDDVLMENRVFHRLAQIAPAWVIHTFAPMALGEWPQAVEFARNVAAAYMLLVIILVLNAFLSAALAIYDNFAISKRIPLKVFVQVLRIVIVCVGIILMLASLMGRSPLVFFSGLGALTAVLLLIFKDSILGLVGGIQLTANDMVRKGDWIEMPRFGADGDVIDVGLTTVKVQNWNKTISTIPTYALITDSFKNWRGMNESGGRRIKRSVSIDVGSIRFCDEEMIERFSKVHRLTDYIARKREELAAHNREHGIDDEQPINGRRMTNVGTFRAYLEAYLRDHPMIHSEGLTFLVRQLPPGPTGLPIEIYVFSKDQEWPRYEAIQADIFDHILAVIPQFGLRVFQEPSGEDVRALAARAGR